MPSSVSVPENSISPEASAGQETSPFEVCPLCGQNNARELLRAPDRFHGRQRNYTIVRCPGCSLAWQAHPPRPQEMGQHYTTEYHRLISAAGESSPHRWQAHQERLTRYKQSGALLDLGCSSGAFLASLPRNTWKLFGVEMSAKEAKTAEQRTGADVFVGDILEAPFAPESFDAITCCDVLEHLYEPQRVIAKVAQWLRPGGIFYVQVPNIDSAEARVFGSYWQGLELPRHLFHYCPISLKALAASAGLQNLSIETRRNPAVGSALRYWGDDIFGRMGIRRTPVAYRGEAGLPWRAMRKLVRLTILRLLLGLAPLAGGGEAIHAVFQKR